MKNIIVLTIIGLLIFTSNLNAQHKCTGVCKQEAPRPDVRSFSNEIMNLLVQQNQIEHSIDKVVNQAKNNFEQKNYLASKEIIKNEVKPLMIEFEIVSEKIRKLILKSLALEDIDKTLRTAIAAPQNIFDNSGLSWIDFETLFVKNYETTMNQMLNAYPELEEFQVELVHIELVPDGNYLTNCDDNLILDELRTPGNQQFPELEYLRDIKECKQAHLLSFIVPANCDAAKGLATQHSLTNMHFQTAYSIVRWDLIEAESTVGIHEAYGHNLGLDHDDYAFNNDMTLVSVMFETFNPQFAGEFYSIMSASKLQATIPLMLSLAQPTDLTIDTDTSTPLETCTGETLSLEVSSNNGTITASGDTELSFNVSNGMLNINSDTPGTYSFTVSANNDAYCYGIESDEFIVTVLPSESETFDHEVCEGESILMENGEMTDVTTSITLSTANGCDRVLTYNITTLTGETIQVIESINQGETFTLIDGTVVDEMGEYFGIQDPNSCDIYNYTIDIVSAVYDTDKEVSIKIFPNPIADYIIIESSKFLVSIEIIDELGRVVSNNTMNSQKSLIDVSQLNSGNYIIKGAFQNKGGFTEKLIKF